MKRIRPKKVQNQLLFGSFFMILYRRFSQSLLLFEVVDFRYRMLAFSGACGIHRSNVLLRLLVNTIEAGFLVACLSRSIFKWTARCAPEGSHLSHWSRRSLAPLHCNQLILEENEQYEPEATTSNICSSLFYSDVLTCPSVSYADTGRGIS
jgi:hypothetical protein